MIYQSYFDTTIAFFRQIFKHTECQKAIFRKPEDHRIVVKTTIVKKTRIHISLTSYHEVN